MNDTRIDPYLFFKGNCREAMEFYKSVFGGELVMNTVGESPTDFPDKEAHKDWIMHAQLKSDSIRLFATDSPQASDSSAKIELSVGGSDETAMHAMFDKLSQGGTVKMPLGKQFWGDTFGQLRDKFGIDWMFNISAR